MAKPNQPLFGVGYELEFFLTRTLRGQTVVYNAAKVLEDQLGFSIDQNTHQSQVIRPCNGFALHTDGTPCELHYFMPGNRGQLRDEWREVIQNIRAISGYLPCFTPFLQSNAGVVFDSPGRVHASGKVLANAYTNLRRDGTKKWDDTKVTRRTVGLHLHFGLTTKGALWSDQVFNQSDYSVSNELIKLLDGIYAKLFLNDRRYYFSSAAKQRVDQYQALGDYRIRSGMETETGNPTLEYRQLDSEMALDWPRVQALINEFQDAGETYLCSLSRFTPPTVAPVIHGHSGEYKPGARTITFGCAHLSLGMLRQVGVLNGDKVGGNRLLSSIKLDSGKTLTMGDISRTLAYIEHVNKEAQSS